LKEYMLSVHHVEGEPPPSSEATQKIDKDVDVLNNEMRSSGTWMKAPSSESFARRTTP